MYCLPLIYQIHDRELCFVRITYRCIMWSLLTAHLQLRACRTTKETTPEHALCYLDDAPLP